MGGDDLREILGRLQSLEPFPHVGLRMLELAGREDVSPSDLVEVIETDAGVTGKVLKLANSAYFGFRREIGSLPEAGTRLGTRALVDLVMTSCAGRYFRVYGSGDPVAAQRLWERSVAAALAARALARATRSVEPERAYTGALLAEVGELVLVRFAPDELAAVERAVATGLGRLDAERGALGTTHAEIGAALAERWGLPASLVDAIRHHHEPERARHAPALVLCVHVAQELARSIEGAEDERASALGLAPGALAAAGLDVADLAAIGELLRTELDQARELLAV